MMSPDWAAYRDRLETESVPLLWENAQDLARLSMQTLFGEFSPIRRDESMGFLRFTGPGVDGHAARLDRVADTMRNFQRLVVATGAALEGHKTLRGHVPSHIAERTQIRLQGSALPGSLILELAPDTLIATEIAPDGQIQLFDQPTSQLVDRSVADAMTLLAQSKNVGPDADSTAFLQALEERGPRVATSLRDLANTLAASQFETEFSWTEPRKATLNLRMSVAELIRLGKLVASRELEKEPVQLEGILRTVSDISPLKLEIAKGEYETVNATEIDKTVIKSLSVGLRVRISTEVTEEKSPGGAPVTHFKATRIEVLEH